MNEARIAACSIIDECKIQLEWATKDRDAWLRIKTQAERILDVSPYPRKEQDNV